MWIYWAFTVPLTILLFLSYFLWVHVRGFVSYLRTKISVGPQFPFCHWATKEKPKDLESLGSDEVNKDIRKGKTKVG
jgi:hypothetical protein